MITSLLAEPFEHFTLFFTLNNYCNYKNCVGCHKPYIFENLKVLSFPWYQICYCEAINAECVHMPSKHTHPY